MWQLIRAAAEVLLLRPPLITGAFMSRRNPYSTMARRPLKHARPLSRTAGSVQGQIESSRIPPVKCTFPYL